MKQLLPGCLLIAGLTALSPSWASGSDDALDARLTWGLGFGGAGALHPGFGLTLGYRLDGLEIPAPVAAFDVTDGIALARLGGLPVLQRSFRSLLDEAPIGDEELVVEELEPEELGQPGTTNVHWGWWAAAGVAALVVAGAGSQAAASEGDGDGPETPGTTGVTVDDDGAYVGCVEGTCAVCPDGSAAEHCGDGFVERMPRGFIVNDETLSRLDAGTGGMGDLIARD